MLPLSIESCAPGKSLFQLIDKIWKGPKGNATLHRICTMMRWMGAESVVLEKVDDQFDEHKRIFQEILAIEKRLSRKVATEVCKLTFLRVVVAESECIELKANKVATAGNVDFLGYTIVVNLVIQGQVERSYIFEAIIRDLFPIRDAAVRVSTILPSHYLHVKKAFECFVLGRKKNYTLIGTFFRQQNAMTNVCAHACASMMLNNCNEITSIITCEDINKILGIDHVNRALTLSSERYGSNEHAADEGIATSELKNVFTHFGFNSHPYNSSDFREFLYGFIESGYPALLTFSTQPQHHVVAVVGHTLNAHSWFPHAFPSYGGKNKFKARYLSSLTWINDFLVHDDNFGMQLLLPAHCFNPDGRAIPINGFAPVEAVGIFPRQKNVQFLAPLAEKAAFKILGQVFRMLFSSERQTPNGNYYVKHLYDRIFGVEDAPPVVLRTSLVERLAYIEHLKQPDNRSRYYLEASRDLIFKKLNKFDRIWLVEITEPDLYIGNLSKVVDVIIDPGFAPGPSEQPNDSRRSLIMMRFPEFLLVPKEVRAEDIEYYPPMPLLHVEGHLPLFRQ